MTTAFCDMVITQALHADAQTPYQFNPGKPLLSFQPRQAMAVTDVAQHERQSEQFLCKTVRNAVVYRGSTAE